MGKMGTFQYVNWQSAPRLGGGGGGGGTGKKKKRKRKTEESHKTDTDVKRFTKLTLISKDTKLTLTFRKTHNINFYTRQSSQKAAGGL